MREFSGKMALAASRYGKEKDYWLNKLSGEWAKSSFPYDQSKTSASIDIQGNETNIAYKLGITNIHFNDKLVEKIVKIAKDSDYMLHMILVAGVAVLLGKYTCSKDIIMGMPVYKREIEGELLNTALVLRNQPGDDMSFKELLLQVRQTIIEADKNQNYPVETLLYHLDMSFSGGDDFPLFDIVVLLENIHQKKDIAHTRPNIIFSFVKNANHIEGTVEYHSLLYHKETIQRIIDYFTRFLEEAIFNIDLPVLSIDILSKEEKEQLLYDFNRTQREYPFEKTIGRLFEEQAARNPDKIAVSDEQGCLTYKMAHERSHRLAVYLQSKGLLTGEAVGIMAENSSGMITGILGILKAGGGYLPLNSEYPAERRKYLLKDVGASKLLTLTHGDSYQGVDVIYMDDPVIYLTGGDPQKKNSPGSLAYIMYTSGSTGNPKGVMIEHRSVIRLVKNTNFVELKEEDRILQTGALDFDASTFEIWGALLNGLQLYLVSKEVVLTPGMIKSALRKNQITTIWMTSPLFNQLVDEDIEIFRGLKSLLVGGDVLSPAHINRVRNIFPALKIINGYGPTENTTFSVTHLIDREYKANIPIGKPIANSTAYILDQQNRPVPIGMFGELCVGGDGLSRGYLNNPELTAEKFYRSYRSYRTYINYKTGDLARWLVNGNIEFLGRIDQQVKIRGYRIEPGEIENQLTRLDNIAEAVLVHKDTGREKYLCAYVVSEGNRPLDFVELKNLLSGRMPEYMVPSYFIQVDRIPLNPNGKVERKLLPEPVLQAEGNYAAPRDHIERSMVSTWSEVLGLGKEVIGIDTDFFQLGGHSLKATLLTARIHKEFNVKIPLAEIFKKPTIRELSTYIKETAAQKHLAIEKVEEKEYYELSSAQKRLYFLQQMNPGGTAYNVTFGLVLDRELETGRLEAIMGQLINRHESMRTSFIQVNNAPVQKIWPAPAFKIEYYETPGGEGIDWARNFIRPFDLAQAPLVRVGIIKEKEKPHMLMVDMHHIITDGTSMKLLLKEIKDLSAGKKLSPLRLQYKDYSEWQRSEMQKEAVRKQEKYWLNRFGDEIPVLDLPTDYIRPAVQGFEGNALHFELSEEQNRELNAFSANTGVTLYIMLLTIYTILLSKLSGQEDIIVGAPIAARRHVDLEGIIGMFVNTLAMRNYPAGEKTFQVFLKEIKEATLEAFENQEYPFEELVDKVNITRDAGRNPLFDVMFVLQNFYDASGIGSISGERIEGFEQEIAKFDLTLAANEESEKLYFSMEYCTKLFKEENILRFIQYFKKIISSVIKDPGQRLAEIEILSAEEKSWILNNLNDPETIYPKDKTIHQLFEEQVEKSPDRIAVLGQPVSLSYRQLDDQANRLAGVLIGKGVLADNIVGIMMERCVEMIIGILAILKAGGAYLPVDPDTPQERIDFMLKDSAAKILLTAVECVFNFHHSSFIIHHSSHLAYIIYTSGSTGKPKGVLTTHANVTRVVRNTNYIDIEPGDRLLQLSNYAFDGSVFDIYGALLNGAELVMISKDDILEVRRFSGVIKREGITVFFVTTALFNTLVEMEIGCFDGVRKVLFGGERVSVEHAGKALAYLGKGRIIHVYGPTETTVYATYYFIDSIDATSGNIPIGKPISNTTVYIFDKYLNPVPIGVPGEIYIGGAGVARGYMNNPELTAEKFIRFYRSDRSYRTYILYKTGDLARWLPDGNIEFLGRIDQQVKIRGFRIEPEEIANRLLRCPEVKEAVVMAREYTNGEKYLCAYVVGGPPSSESHAAYISSLRERLAGELPGYMTPGHIVLLEKMPLTPNGKVDMKALPGPAACPGREYTAPRDEIEIKLVGLWSEILGVPHTSISIDDDFFQVGGHSLNATILVSRIHKMFNVEMPLSEAFIRPTAGEMAEYIRQASYKKYYGIEPVEKREYYPLSSAQKRLYFLQQMDPQSTAYNMPLALHVGSDTGKDALESTLKRLIARHESLRTSFEMIAGEPVQRIHDTVEFEITKILGPKAFIRPFDLSWAPLIRAAIIESPGNKPTWIVDIHHIISDGTSHMILAEDFMAFYNHNGKGLQPLKLQYKDYSQWQNRVLESGKFKAQEDYWLRLYADAAAIPRLNLPTDYNRPVVFTFAGSNYEFMLGNEIAAGFKAITARNGGTLYMNILTALNALFYKYTGQTDIIIGSGVAGRPHADLHRIIGMFVNMLGMRNYPHGEKTYDLFLKEVVQNSITAFENQDVQFEELVEKLGVERNPSRNPLFDISMLVQNFKPMGKGILLPLVDESFSPEEYKNSTAKFDMTFFIDDVGEDVVINIEYYTGIFKEETVKRLARHCKNIIEAVVADPSLKLKDIDIIPGEEKRQVLYDFNNTAAEYPGDMTIHGLFEEQVQKGCDRVAVVVTGAGYFSYGALELKANRLARYLLDAQKIQADDRVGILLNSSIELAAAVLGILKAGAAYVPLDPLLPEERMKYMIDDADIAVVISEEKYIKLLNRLQSKCRGFQRSVCVDRINIHSFALYSAISPGSLAYIIYTSGTTGKPKGVEVEHRGVVNMLLSRRDAYEMNPWVVALQLFSYGFDGFVTGFFTPLISGARLVMLEREKLGDIEKIRVEVKRYGVTHFIIVPSLFSALVESVPARDLWSLKVVTLAGERLKRSVVESAAAKIGILEIVNEYGVTEGSVMSTIYRRQERDMVIKIGKPIRNTQLYILDEYYCLRPLGAPGELYIAGHGLARGYLNNPELTAEKFICFHHSSFIIHHSKFYRTGDLARWLPGGNIEFLGRIDQQVKIRGFRIELGEIENRLVNHTDIKEALVTAKTDECGDKYLCAYIVSARELEVAELKEYLAGGLPNYMIPSHFVFLEKIPLTPNGKIDRKALPQPEPEKTDNYTAPRDEIENKLLTLWLEILGKDRLIGITDNFFEVGGHSLRATVLTSRIQKEWDVNVPLAELFKSPTIKELARYIRVAAKGTYIAVEPAEKKEYYPLSSAQGRFYILQEVTPESTAYNMTAAFEVAGLFAKEKFETSLRKLINRHAILRTSFQTINGKPVQRVHDEVEFEIKYHNFAADERCSGQTRSFLLNFIRAFELSKAPLLRVSLVEISQDRRILLFDMHHIISDGTSMTIFLKEFMTLYSGGKLPSLPLQYKDFAQWQHDRLVTGKLEMQREYWLKRFAGELPVLNMPTDFPRPAIQSFEGDKFEFKLEKSVTAALKNIMKEAGLTLYMALLAVYNILLARYTGQEDIVIGTTIAGRHHADLQGIIGLLIETLVQRNYPMGRLEFKMFLEMVKQETLEIHENQAFPFREIIRLVGADNEVSRNPVFDAMLIVQNAESAEFQLPGLKFSLYRPAEADLHKTSKVDFTIEVFDSEEIHFTLEYCTRLYKRETMERFARHFLNIIGEVAANPSVPLTAIKVIDEAERKQLLETFNDTSHKSSVEIPGMVLNRFQDQAAKTPDRIAIIGLGQVVNDMVFLTYRGLNESADGLADELIAKGVQPETIVAIMMESSLEMAVGIWGILKAGGAYLPIEPGAPAERIDYMLKDSAAKILLTANEIASLAAGCVFNFHHSSFDLPRIHHSNLSYLIYTSGTSGHPKGVMVEHRNLANYIVAVTNEIGLRPDDTVLQQGSLVFDAFVEEFYPLLVIGGKVAVPGKMLTRDIPALCQFIARHRVSMISSAPQMVNELNKALRDGLPAPLNARELLASMRIVLVGGDVVKADYIDKFMEQAEAYNTYGPTESTVCATYYKCSESPGLSGDVPIGKPLAKYKIYIEDKYGNPAPIGVGGELCVGGPGVTRGYMNQPELTCEKFIKYRSYRSYKTYINYKTGDLARWLNNGNIEFLGRIDRQVKIRGYRIELAEIETRLTTLANIKEAVVIDEARKSGDKYLAAYVVCPGTFDPGEIKSRLARQLPDYMIPTYIIKVEQIPWTGIGKVDRKRLPRPQAADDSRQSFIAPGSETEKRLAGIWRQILEKDRIGIDDNFFDLGGTSLDIIKLNTRIKEEFNKKIPVVSLFQYTTIRTLTQFIAEEEPEKQAEIEILEAIKKGQAKFKGRLERRVEAGRTGLEIAVIGMAGIFPGARNLPEFWENLKNGAESIHFFSDEELLEDGVEPAALENPNYIKARGIIAGIEYFDASFFGYTPLEARIMDPQIRIFQQTAWHALEDAGYDPFSYNRRIGLYAGASPNYYWVGLTLFAGMGRNVSGFMAAQLADKDFMCTHTSYKLNLKGPSVSLQTACSTSLVAIHNAVQGLLHGECEMALAGGVSIAYPNKRGYIYQPGMIFSSDGHNRSFDARADGSIFGDGVGVVVLKSLEDAIADRDHIYAVIKGSAINNDGLRKVGYTAPSIQGQAEVIRAAISMAEVEPESITYIEAHGTATPLGDTVEIEALEQAFHTDKKRFCAVGALKSNMGHLYSAAGAAGFIKTVLALNHRLIPPSLHFQIPNPQIDFQDSPFYVNTTLKEWNTERYPLRAGVSAFGIGGTNAHVVLEEWDKNRGREEREVREERKLKLLLLSARTPSALNKMTENLVQYLQENTAVNLADVAYTLQVGRKHFPYRRMMVSADLHPGQDPGLLAQAAQRTPIAQAKEENRPIIFMFCGQGSQYAGMGIDLYRTEPVFRQELDQCFEILKPLAEYDVKEILYPSSGGNRSNGSYRTNTIDQTEVAQPVLFAFEYALAKLLMSWGIRPTAMIGYSFGEYVAACLAGVFSPAEALEMIVARGRLVQQTPVGKMTSVTLPERELKPLLTAGVSIAIVNGPTCIVSGKKEDVEAFEKEMKQKRLICVPLNMSHAVHSAVMNPIRGAFEQKISGFRLNKPQIPFISNVTAQWITAAEVTSPGYWGEHLCSTVRFSDGLTELLKQENAIFIEIGPGRILGMMIRVHVGKKPGHLIFNTVKHPQENAADDYFLLEKLGQLWQQGQVIDWVGFYGGEKRNRVSLPGYPFEGKRFWIDPKGLTFGGGLPGAVQIEERANGEGLQSHDETAAPRSELEHMIARLWQELMGLDSVGIHDDFFRLNGSSLVATQIIARLMQEYDIEIPMNGFYEQPTIAHLAEIITGLQENKNEGG